MIVGGFHALLLLCFVVFVARSLDVIRRLERNALNHAMQQPAASQ
jgi:hypothetical protein